MKSPNVLGFRSYLEEDFPELEKMIVLLYSEDPDGETISSLKIRNTLAEFRRFSEKGKIYIFTMNDSIIGYAIVVCFWSNEFGGDILYIDEIYVKEEYRNKRVGSQFFNYLDKNGDAKTKALAVEVTRRNTRAKNLYEKLGFEISSNNHLVKKTH